MGCNCADVLVYRLWLQHIEIPPKSIQNLKVLHPSTIMKTRPAGGDRPHGIALRPSTVWSDASKNIGPHSENGHRLLESCSVQDWRHQSYLERLDICMNKIVR